MVSTSAAFVWACHARAGLRFCITTKQCGPVYDSREGRYAVVKRLWATHRKSHACQWRSTPPIDRKLCSIRHPRLKGYVGGIPSWTWVLSEPSAQLSIGRPRFPRLLQPTVVESPNLLQPSSYTVLVDRIAVVSCTRARDSGRRAGDAEGRTPAWFTAINAGVRSASSHLQVVLSRGLNRQSRT